MSELLNPRDAAARIGISRATLYSLVGQRKIRHVRPTGSKRGRIKFLPSDLDAWLESCAVEPKSGDGQSHWILPALRKLPLPPRVV